jgi:hypothetical protein
MCSYRSMVIGEQIDANLDLRRSRLIEPPAPG